MATYKLIQDIEAEDKLIGPLSLRQFIFALVGSLFFYLSFIVIAKKVAFLAIFLLPPALFCGFFAIPFGKDQSTEVWALAKIRFYLKPRRRIWDQSGAKELVTITVPKKVEKFLTDGLGQDEVQSRLHALANTIDSRGWAVKNVNVNMYSQTNPFMSIGSDRLVDVKDMPQEVPNNDVQASDDILDATSNPIAQQFEQMIQKSELEHKQKIVESMNKQTDAQNGGANKTPADYWFMNQPSGASKTVPRPGYSSQQAVLAGSTGVTPLVGNPAPTAPPTPVIDEVKATKDLKSKHADDDALYSHMRTLTPINEKPEPAAQPTPQPSPASTDPAIISLANNNDLNVATIAREASRTPPHDEEVVISLH